MSVPPLSAVCVNPFADRRQQSSPGAPPQQAPLPTCFHCPAHPSTSAGSPASETEWNSSVRGFAAELKLPPKNKPLERLHRRYYGISYVSTVTRTILGLPRQTRVLWRKLMTLPNEIALSWALSEPYTETPHPLEATEVNTFIGRGFSWSACVMFT